MFYAVMIAVLIYTGDSISVSIDINETSSVALGTDDTSYANAPIGIKEISNPSEAINADELSNPSEALGTNETSHPSESQHKSNHVSIHVASWRWSYVSTPFVLTVFILCAGILKIGFHHANALSSLIPESCILIILGVIVGAISGPMSTHFVPHFTSSMFFLFLLPPIVLEAAYSLHDRAFLRNVGTILLFAVVGTIINFFLIGMSLYGFGTIGVGMLSLTIPQALVFSALISAVDPVAVLAIFQEIGVNKDLYFLVFGESLLNDAVTVVLYGTMETFTKMTAIDPSQYGLGIAAFLTVNIGGLSIGTVVGALTSILTKYTETVRVVEPLAFLGLAYFSYLFAELFHFSGIISIIACGLVQAHYGRKNISEKSYVTIKYFTKMLSSVCDSIIFFFLGLVLVETQHVWHTGFICITITLCLVCRFIGVYFLTAIVNNFRQRKINFEEQFIMAYGGLRGAVSFSLVLLLNSEFVSSQDIFVTTTLSVIIFTVFVQGITIKPLVKLLRIKTSKAEKTSLFDEINYKVIGHLMVGIEEISGSLGDYYVKEWFHHFNSQYIKPYLVKSENVSGNLNKLYEKISLADHYANLYGPSICLEDKKPLTKVMNAANGDFSQVVETMINNGPAVDLHANVSDLEVQLREPSKLKKVQEQLRNSLPFLPRQQRYDQGATSQLRMNHRQTLRRALSNNPYEKLHFIYNKNLVNDDDQEVSSHLQRRCTNAKKLTSIILTPPCTPTSVTMETNQPVETSSLLSDDSRLHIYDVTQMLINRARNTRRKARGRSVSEQSRPPHTMPGVLRSVSLDGPAHGPVGDASILEENLEVVIEDPIEMGKNDGKDRETNF